MPTISELLDEHEEASARWRFSHERVVAEINDGADRKRLDAARQGIESLFATLTTKIEKLMESVRAVEHWNSQQRYRDMAREATERYGFKEGELQWLWRGLDCFKRKYDTGEVIAAICDALTREGQTAWSGDGTSCVEQMIRLQWDRAERAEAELAALSLENKNRRQIAMDLVALNSEKDWEIQRLRELLPTPDEAHAIEYCCTNESGPHNRPVEGALQSGRVKLRLLFKDRGAK